MQKRKREIIKEFSDYRKDQLLDGRFTSSAIMANLILTLHYCRLEADKFNLHVFSHQNSEFDWFYRMFTRQAMMCSISNNCPRMCSSGGGVVACELAQFLTRIGCRVIQLQRSSHILKNLPRISEVVESAMRKEGVDLRTVFLQSFENFGNERTLVNFEHQGQSHPWRPNFYSMPWVGLPLRIIWLGKDWD